MYAAPAPAAGRLVSAAFTNGWDPAILRPATWRGSAGSRNCWSAPRRGIASSASSPRLLPVWCAAPTTPQTDDGTAPSGGCDPPLRDTADSSRVSPSRSRHRQRLVPIDPRAIITGTGFVRILADLMMIASSARGQGAVVALEVILEVQAQAARVPVWSSRSVTRPVHHEELAVVEGDGVFDTRRQPASSSHGSCGVTAQSNERHVAALGQHDVHRRRRDRRARCSARHASPSSGRKYGDARAHARASPPTAHRGSVRDVVEVPVRAVGDSALAVTGPAPSPVGAYQRSRRRGARRVVNAQSRHEDVLQVGHDRPVHLGSARSATGLGLGRALAQCPARMFIPPVRSRRGRSDHHDSCGGCAGVVRYLKSRGTAASAERPPPGTPGPPAVHSPSSASVISASRRRSNQHLHALDAASRRAPGPARHGIRRPRSRVEDVADDRDGTARPTRSAASMTGKALVAVDQRVRCDCLPATPGLVTRPPRRARPSKPECMASRASNRDRS